MSYYETSRLVFKPDADDPDKWWAIDADNVEYCVSHPLAFDGWRADLWAAVAQKRVAFNEVKAALGTYDDFADAAEACDAFDPAAEGLLGI